MYKELDDDFSKWIRSDDYSPHDLHGSTYCYERYANMIRGSECGWFL